MPRRVSNSTEVFSFVAVDAELCLSFDLIKDVQSLETL